MMTEFQILQKIATNLVERKSSVALSNYEVLCNNIKFVNDLYKYTIHSFYRIQLSIVESLKNETLLNNDYKENSPLNPFVAIIPRILANGLSVIDKFALYAEPDDRSGVSLDNVSVLRRGFLHYNHLVTASRQYIDSIISDSYQLCLLNPKSFNYHVLVSLNSFNKYATKSISQSLFNKDVEDALREFRKLRFKDWENSAITECSHPTFANKVDFLFSELGLSSETDFAEELKNLFKFSSEFTHIGYVSTFFTSSPGAEFIFGDDTSPYLPSTENFSELKYVILESSCKALTVVYLPSVKKSLEKIFVDSEKKKYVTVIDQLIDEVNGKLRTRNSQYYFFIKKGLIGSKQPIELKCMCGAVRVWNHPHDKADLYCSTCGSSFNLLEVEGDGGYIITSSGPAKIIGTDVPDFEKLPEEEQIKMMKEVDKLKKEKFGN